MYWKRVTFECQLAEIRRCKVWSTNKPVSYISVTYWYIVYTDSAGWSYVSTWRRINLRSDRPVTSSDEWLFPGGPASNASFRPLVATDTPTDDRHAVKRTITR